MFLSDKISNEIDSLYALLESAIRSGQKNILDFGIAARGKADSLLLLSISTSAVVGNIRITTIQDANLF